MKVRQLVELLLKQDQDALVCVEPVDFDVDRPWGVVGVKALSEYGYVAVLEDGRIPKELGKLPWNG